MCYIDNILIIFSLEGHQQMVQRNVESVLWFNHLQYVYVNLY